MKETGLGDSGLEHNVIAFGFDGKKYPMRAEIYDEELEENLEAFMKVSVRENLKKSSTKIYYYTQIKLIV